MGESSEGWAVKIVFFSPSDLEVGIAPNEIRRLCVTVRLLGVEERTGMTPGTGLALALYPKEAIALGELLIQKAREAQASES